MFNATWAWPRAGAGSVPFGVLRGLSWTALACALVVSTTPVHAQSAEEMGQFLDSTQRWLQEAAEAAQVSTPQVLRVEVQVGQLNTRLKLAPCARVEPYIPPGTRLWGRARLGLRCMDGVSKWNVFLPVTIKAFGPAWVLRNPVTPGAVLTPQDVMEGEIDWAEDAAAVLVDPSQWLGQIAAKAMSAGQALRSNSVKPAQAFAVGALVRVVAQGKGFSIATEAQALTSGVVGQLARVRLENGRIAAGLVLDSKTVKIEI